MRLTVGMRLTLWYAGIFTVSSAVAFVLFYLLITSLFRQQIDEDLTNKAGELTTLMQLRGIVAVKRVAILEARAAGIKKIFIRLLSPTGAVFSSSNMSYWQNIEINQTALENLLRGQTRVFDTITISDEDHKIRVLYSLIRPDTVLQLGRSMETYGHFIKAFQRIFILTMAALTLLATAIGWFLARRAMSGVEAVTRTASRISEGSLDERVPVKTHPDEIDRLAQTFNRMVDRIQKLVSDMKEMSDNIAHDLKSPLTRIRGVAEVTLVTGSSLPEYQNMAASIIEDCDRLLDIINTMLTISKTDAGIAEFETGRINLTTLIKDACSLYQPIAEDKRIQLRCKVDTRVEIEGDMRMIQRMIANMLDNAVKYTPPSGQITVELERQADDRARVTIKDTGPGIKPEDKPNIFKRFYRGDMSRSEPGTGLGLSLARAVARAHNGNIEVESEPGQGSTFILTLPACSLPTQS